MLTRLSRCPGGRLLRVYLHSSCNLSVSLLRDHREAMSDRFREDRWTWQRFHCMIELDRYFCNIQRPVDHEYNRVYSVNSAGSHYKVFNDPEEVEQLSHSCPLDTPPYGNPCMNVMKILQADLSSVLYGLPGHATQR